MNCRSSASSVATTRRPTSRRAMPLANLRCGPPPRPETCSCVGALLLQSLFGGVSRHDALAPAGRPIRQRRGCRSRWLLRRESDSQVRLQVTANPAASKHIVASRNHGKQGAPARRSRRRDGRRPGHAHLWRIARPAQPRGIYAALANRRACRSFRWWASNTEPSAGAHARVTSNAVAQEVMLRCRPERTPLMGLQLAGLNGRFERRDSGMSGYAMWSCRRHERTLCVLDAAMNGR